MPDATRMLTHFYITLNGSDATAEMLGDLLHVTVETSLYLPDAATISLHDPRLRWVDDQTLEPGRTLQIAAKADGDSKPLFDGEIVEIEPVYEDGSQRLLIRALDRLHRLARGRHVRSYLNTTDGDLVQKIAQETGLQAKVGPTSQVFPYVLQANETNLEFLQKRASALGYLLYVDGTTLACVPPEQDKDTVELAWNKDLKEFRPRMTTLGQVSNVTVRGWDTTSCRAIVGRASNGQTSVHVGESQTGGDMAESAFNINADYLVADRPIRVQATADTLAKAVADYRASKFIEAEGVCPGNPAVVSGALLKISAVGDRFSGDYLVTGARHEWNMEQGYETLFTVSGYHPTTLLSLLAVEPKTDTRTTPVSGLAIAVVTDNQDPDGLGRVKVKYPWLSDDHASYWTRVVIVGGGAQRGIEFLPEVNDEVVVGFELGDAAFPFVLGGLWNGRDAPPKSNADIIDGGNVQQRLIRSRTGHFLIFDDSDSSPSIQIIDRDGNLIKLDCTDDSLNITVAGDARLTAQGNLQFNITGDAQMTVGGNMTFDVTGSMNVNATQGITLQSDMDIDLQAQMDIDLEAQMDVDIQASVNVDIQASAEIGIQGALVNIN